jgi:hypothetical protein
LFIPHNPERIIHNENENLDIENAIVEILSPQGFFEACSPRLWQSQKVVSNIRQSIPRSSSHHPERIHTMKSNLAIIEDKAIFNVSKAGPKPKVSTVAKGVKLPALQATDPVFDRKFGTEGHTLGEAIEHQAAVYKSLVKQRKGQLEKLKGIGEVLLELRSISGASDKDYGKLVSKTPLGIMSRQDRSDAMWLATEWLNVKAFMKDMDMSSASAAYLRQQMRKAKPKAEAEEQSTETTSQGSDEPSTQATESSEAAESAEVDATSVDSFAISVAAIAKSQGFSVAELIASLQKIA